MSDNLRSVVVTGATRGLGLVLVKEFASNGWHTAGVGRSARPEEFPDQAEYYRFDASDAHLCRDFWAKFAGGGLLPSGEDLCLINNAGIYVRGGLLDTDVEVFEQSIRGNYLAAVHMTRTLIEAAQSARIVNIISTSAQQAKSTNSAYGSAKAGLAQFFRSLQQEFPPERYRITNLYPGTIRTHGEGPDVSAIEPVDLSDFVRSLVLTPSSFYVSEATILPALAE